MSAAPPGPILPPMTSTGFPVIPPARVVRLAAALPFWLSLGLLPLAWFAAFQGVRMQFEGGWRSALG